LISANDGKPGPRRGNEETAMQGLVSLLGRLALAVIFLSSAIMNKIPNWNATLNYMQDQGGLPGGALGSFLLFGAVVFLIAGGLSLILGFYARIGAILLMIFLAAATLSFHDFWTFEGAEQRQQQIQFMKNLAIFGGLLMVFAHGAGPWALKRRRKTKPQAQPAANATG
jgi:putative oxidoreductase